MVIFNDETGEPDGGVYRKTPNISWLCDAYHSESERRGEEITHLRKELFSLRYKFTGFILFVIIISASAAILLTILAATEMTLVTTLLGLGISSWAIQREGKK
jgi:hypothetical protein